MALLLHATTGRAAKKILREGFKVTPQTKKGTAYCKRDDYDCMRLAAYTCSEIIHEENRRKLRPEIPTRKNAVFFSVQDYDSVLDDLTEYLSEPRYDDYGREIREFDFGFGKTDLFVVDSSKIPCKCGVGDTHKADEPFGACMTIQRGGRGDPFWDRPGEPNVMSIEQLQGYAQRRSEAFWKNAEVYNPETYDPTEPINDENDPKHDRPEVWCSCAIPPDAIVRHINAKNYSEERYDLQESDLEIRI